MPQKPLTLTRAERYEWTLARLKPEASGSAGAGLTRPGLRPIGALKEPCNIPPDLFRRFQGLDLNDALVFANEYGTLGLPSIAVEEDIEVVEPQWWDEILAVWRTVAAMDTLRGHASLQTQESILNEVRASKRDRDRLLAGIVASEISSARQRHQLLSRLTAVEHGGQFDFSEDPAPTTLIGVIWMQVTLAVTGKADWFPCAGPGCNRVVKRTSEKPGPWGQFCGSNCRAKEDQRRLSAARLLARERQSARRIADNTGLSVERVRKVIEAERAKATRRQQKKRAAGSGIG